MQPTQERGPSPALLSHSPRDTSNAHDREPRQGEGRVWHRAGEPRAAQRQLKGISRKPRPPLDSQAVLTRVL